MVTAFRSPKHHKANGISKHIRIAKAATSQPWVLPLFAIRTHFRLRKRSGSEQAKVHTAVAAVVAEMRVV